MSHNNIKIFQFLGVPLFRNVTLKCLTEIAGVTVTNYDDMFVILFTDTMTQLEQVASWRFSMSARACVYL